ncbi:MAG TPA: sugar ABC transporter permease [Ktedonobacteraceae bacterium]|jgi:ABC-type sugar transport system permease subunit|nr:sugar ABC transporter permease [Ktedonobacteraceae bacterium]
MATQAQVQAPVQAVKASGKPSLRERLDLGNGLLPYFLVLPTIVVILAVAAYPILNSFWLSLLNNPLSPSASFTGLTNYSQLFADSTFRGTIGVTFVFTAISVALETVLGLGIALLINGTFPGRGLVRASILVPWAFPTVISADIWLLMYNDRTGVVSYILQQIHILAPGATLLQTNSGIIIAAIITDVWKTTPFMALLILAGLQVIPNELYEAASVDGSSRWQQFWTITLPMLSGPLVIALLFRTLASLGVFDLFYVLAGNQVQSIASYSYNYMFTRSTFDFASGVSASVVLFLIGLIVSLGFVMLMRVTRR